MGLDQGNSELRKRIGQTSSILRQVDSQGDAITAGATARLEQVNARLDKLRGNAITDRAAADEYLDLTKEKGALLRALAMP
jgi:hypothetical protein